jgi:glycosyltransferase involved in cell wall biosynthesis
MLPEVSILTPTNTLQFLTESIASVELQTFSNWELLIGANNYKNHPSLYEDIICAAPDDSRVKIIDLPEARSKSAALNELINHCSSEIVCLLDSDDIWLPTKLEKQIPLIQKYDVVGTSCSYFGPQSAPYGDGPSLPLGEISPQSILLSNPIINSSAMFHKNDGKWDPECEGVEDYDMWLRLNHAGRTFYNMPEELCLHRIHHSSSFNFSTFNQLIENSQKKWKF